MKKIEIVWIFLNIRKTIDVNIFYAIITYSAMKFTQTVEYAQYATGGG